ncbi:MAG TPA: cell division/cell wall cluster transcriptional repressor MraZ [Bacillota bacterium]|nr:cell division/cell wall cluster transcriptional repressor MraZ [Bacillota bacterium]
MARYTHTVDNKGRVIVPAKLRESLDGVLIVTQGIDEGFLAAYTPEQFDSIKEQILHHSSTGHEIRKLKRDVLGSSTVCEFDGQGRISVPAFLWKQIQVEPGEEICFIDVFDKIEICSQSFFDKNREEETPLADMDLSRYEIRGL